jgi:hypothetical protein
MPNRRSLIILLIAMSLALTVVEPMIIGFAGWRVLPHPLG